MTSFHVVFRITMNMGIRAKNAIHPNPVVLMKPGNASE